MIFDLQLYRKRAEEAARQMKIEAECPRRRILVLAEEHRREFREDMLSQLATTIKSRMGVAPPPLRETMDLGELQAAMEQRGRWNTCRDLLHMLDIFLEEDE